MLTGSAETKELRPSNAPVINGLVRKAILTLSTGFHCDLMVSSKRRDVSSTIDIEILLLNSINSSFFNGFTPLKSIAFSVKNQPKYSTKNKLYLAHLKTL